MFDDLEVEPIAIYVEITEVSGDMKTLRISTKGPSNEEPMWCGNLRLDAGRACSYIAQLSKGSAMKGWHPDHTVVFLTDKDNNPKEDINVSAKFQEIGPCSYKTALIVIDGLIPEQKLLPRDAVAS